LTGALRTRAGKIDATLRIDKLNKKKNKWDLGLIVAFTSLFFTIVAVLFGQDLI
jgi:hypothetical protein